MKCNFARNVQHLCHGASGDGPITIRKIWTNRNHGPVTTQTHSKIEAATALKYRMHSCKKNPYVCFVDRSNLYKFTLSSTSAQDRAREKLLALWHPILKTLLWFKNVFSCRKIIPGIPFTIHQPPMPTCRDYSKQTCPQVFVAIMPWHPLLTYLPVPKMLTLQLVKMIVFGTFMQT